MSSFSRILELSGGSIDENGLPEESHICSAYNHALHFNDTNHKSDSYSNIKSLAASFSSYTYKQSNILCGYYKHCQKIPRSAIVLALIVAFGIRRHFITLIPANLLR